MGLEPQKSESLVVWSPKRAAKSSIISCKWHERMMQEAEVQATYSTCLRRHCGAVIVKGKRRIASGYNGAPEGVKECLVIGKCIRNELGIPSGERQELCRATHAEQNAIIQAARYGVSIEGASLYVTDTPCAICAKMIINAGITNVYYRGEYPDGLAKELLKEAGVGLFRIGKQPSD